jgi:hypothetical protein
MVDAAPIIPKKRDDSSRFIYLSGYLYYAASVLSATINAGMEPSRWRASLFS